MNESVESCELPVGYRKIQERALNQFVQLVVQAARITPLFARFVDDHLDKIEFVGTNLVTCEMNAVVLDRVDGNPATIAMVQQGTAIREALRGRRVDDVRTADRVGRQYQIRSLEQIVQDRIRQLVDPWTLLYLYSALYVLTYETAHTEDDWKGISEEMFPALLDLMPEQYRNSPATVYRPVIAFWEWVFARIADLPGPIQRIKSDLERPSRRARTVMRKKKTSSSKKPAVKKVAKPTRPKLKIQK